MGELFIILLRARPFDADLFFLAGLKFISRGFVQYFLKTNYKNLVPETAQKNQIYVSRHLADLIYLSRWNYSMTQNFKFFVLAI